MLSISALTAFVLAIFKVHLPVTWRDLVCHDTSTPALTVDHLVIFAPVTWCDMLSAMTSGGMLNTSPQLCAAGL